MARPVKWQALLVVICSFVLSTPLFAVAVKAPRRQRPTAGVHGRISPDGRFLAYVVRETNERGSGETTSIFIRRADRPSRSKRLTGKASRDDFPAFSADGRTVYYHSNKSGLTKIWSVNIRGGKPSQVTFGPSQDYHPSPSPRGRYLAYDSNRSGNYDIWLRDLRNGEDRQITTARGPDFSPTWSPQEKAIAFTSNRGEGFQIYLYRFDKKGGALRKMTEGKAVHAHPAWSPDGRYLAYDRDDKGVVSVWVKELRRPYRSFRLTGAPWSEEVPNWYPSGEKLAYTINQTGDKRVAVAPLPPLPNVESAPMAQGAKSAPGNLMAAATPIPFAPQVGVQMDTPGTPHSPPQAFGEPLPRQNAIPGIREPLSPPEDIDFLQEAKEVNSDDDQTLLSFVGEGASDKSRRRSARPKRSQPKSAGSFRGESTPNYSNVASLKVLQFFPKLKQEGIKPPRSLSVVFNRRLASVQNIDQLMSLIDDRGTITPLVCSYNPNLRRIDAMPVDPLSRNRTYTVRLSEQFSGEGGEMLTGGFSWTFATKRGGKPIVKIRKVEEIPFSVVERTPNQNGAAPAAKVVVRFSKPLDASTVAAGSIMLFDGRGSKVTGEVLFPDGNDTLQLTPYDKLKAGQKYRVFVSQNLRSVNGEKLPKALVWSFTTNHGSPLLVADYEPKGFLGPRSDITIHFNRAVSSDSLSTGKVFLKIRDQNYSGNTILGTGGKSLLFVPHRKLPNKSELTLVLPPGLSDEQGNELVLNAQLKFTTKYTEKSAAMSVSSILKKHNKGKGEGLNTSSYLKGRKRSGVGKRSWIYKSLHALYRKGYVDRNLSGDLSQGRPLTRHKSALMVESAMKSIGLMAAEDQAHVRKLAQEFKSELHWLGVKLSGFLSRSSNRFVGKG